jgi:plasmid stabilization system protein ParE
LAHRYRVAPRALADVREILDKISAHNPRAADGVLDRIVDKFEMIAQFPESGAASPTLGVGIRVAVTRPYLIIYRVHDRIPRIVGVSHGARSLADLELD